MRRPSDGLRTAATSSSSNILEYCRGFDKCGILEGSHVFPRIAGSFCSRLAAGERIFEDKFASLDHVFVQRRVFRIVDFAPLASGAESVDRELFGQQPAEQSSRVEAIAHRC